MEFFKLETDCDARFFENLFHIFHGLGNIYLNCNPGYFCSMVWVSFPPSWHQNSSGNFLVTFEVTLKFFERHDSYAITTLH